MTGNDAAVQVALKPESCVQLSANVALYTGVLPLQVLNTPL